MSLLNKGLISTDYKAEHFAKTRKPKVKTPEALFQQAFEKIQAEMHKAKYGMKTKEEEFKESFYNQVPQKKSYPSYWWKSFLKLILFIINTIIL